jgi:hypothetical protein
VPTSFVGDTFISDVMDDRGSTYHAVLHVDVVGPEVVAEDTEEAESCRRIVLITIYQMLLCQVQIYCQVTRI